MSGFSVSFSSAASALDAIQQGLNAVQNNIVNSSTPGYAAENVSFESQGLAGGVEVSLSSTRDQYLEQANRTQLSALGLVSQQSSSLNSLQSAFSASGDSGVPGALSSFTNSFSALSASPSDPSLRANVIAAAATVAQAFNQTAAQISQVSTEASQQASATVAQINTLTEHIASLNTEIQNGAQADAGVAADLNNSLDTLSGLVNISITNNSDGTASVLLDGQTPLVIGGTADALQVQNQPSNPNAQYPNGLPGLQLVDQNGVDVTGQASQGQLGGALQIVNQIVPQYLGNQNQLGSLNQLAKTFADRVNTILTSGQVSTGPPPVQGSALFTYDPGSDTNAASTLAVSSTITGAQIATIGSTSSDGVATELSDLTNPTNPLDLIDGQSFTAFYGQVAGQAGSASAQATTNLTTQQDLSTQAQNQLTQASGVSLNAQAAQLLSLQQAYQATAKIVSILQTLSQAAINLIPQGQ